MNAGAPIELPFEYDGPDELRAQVLEALRQVIDPELAMNIVDIGLVYEVVVSGSVAHVRMTMTSAACPVTDMLVEEVRAELGDALGADYEVDVELVWEPPWTPDRLSESARRFMGW